MEPYLLITGNSSPYSWACKDIIKQPPKLFKCVGSQVYVQTHDDIVYKIDSRTRNHTKIEAENFESAGFDFTLTVREQNVYSRGKNQYGQLGLGHFDNCDSENFVSGMNYPIEKVAVGSCSCFAIIQNRSCFHNYLKKFLEVNQSEEHKEDLGFTVQTANNTSVSVHSVIASIHKLPETLKCTREVAIFGLRILYGELTDQNLVQWIAAQV